MGLFLEFVRYTCSLSLAASAFLVLQCPCPVAAQCKLLLFFGLVLYPLFLIGTWNVVDLLHVQAKFAAASRQGLIR